MSHNACGDFDLPTVIGHIRPLFWKEEPDPDIRGGVSGESFIVENSANILLNEKTII